LAIFSKLGDFVGLAIVAAAQLALDRLQLLVEVIFALGLFHLALHAATDATLHLEHAQFAFHEAEDHLQPLERIGFREQRLLVGHLGADMRGDRIGQLAGVLDVAELIARVLRQLLVQLGVFAELVDDAAHHGGDFGALGLDRLDRLDLRHQQIGLFLQFAQLGARLALDQHAHRAVGQFEKLQHAGDHAHIVEIVGMRIVAGRVELGQQEDVLVTGHRGFQRRHGFFAPDEQGNHHAGEHHDVSQGQKGKKRFGHIHPIARHHHAARALCLTTATRLSIEDMGSLGKQRNGRKVQECGWRVWGG
jgi:hypothetical protein